MNAIMTRNDPLDDFFRGFFVRPAEFDPSRTASEIPAMRLDVSEAEGKYVVQAELPGVAKEDIHVSVDGPIVSISAERRREEEATDGERVLRTERHFGKISRSFQLAEEVDEDQASAKFADGVLSLMLPKKVPPQAKRLAID